MKVMKVFRTLNMVHEKIESKVSAAGCGHLKIFHLRSEMVQMSVVPLR